MKLYKLTDSSGNTQNNTHWEIGTTVSVSGVSRLCSDTVLHAYPSPLLAALMNPAHGKFADPRCFTVEGDVAVSDGTKVGCQRMTVTGTFDLPKLTTVQRVAFGILCALEVYKDPSFEAWAEGWISGKDRSRSAASNAANAADATYAATYAACAAYDAAYDATYAATYAAAAAAAYAAATKTKSVDFQRLAEKALDVPDDFASQT